MQVEVITRIIFKIPEEAEAVEAMQEQLKSNPNPGVRTHIIRTYNSVEFCMSRCQEGPIDRQDPKARLECLTCKYENVHFWEYPCRGCSKLDKWRSK